MIREKLVSERNERNVQRYGKISFNKSGDVGVRGSNSVRRPMTAQPKFSASFHQSLISIVKQNNEFRNNYGVQSISKEGIQRVRPQTAATQRRSGDFRTLDNRSFNHSLSYGTISQGIKRKKKNAKKINDIEIKQSANENGNVLFSGIPKGIYQIEVLANERYNYTSREVNLTQIEEVDNACTIYVPLDKHITTYTSLYIIKNQNNWDSYNKEISSRQFFDNLRVKAIELEHIREVNSDDEDVAENEFEFVFDKKDKCYRWPLHPGKYMIIVVGENIKEYNEIIKVKDRDILKEIVPEKLN